MFVAVVDNGMGNLDSVRRSLEVASATVSVTDDPREIAEADRVVLPGVGAFPAAMANLRKRGLIDILRREVIDQGMPFLGICLGMQVLAEVGHEHMVSEGLGWIPGTVERLIADQPADRIPHVGWNEVHFSSDHPLLAGIDSGHDFYFVHSFHMRCEARYVLGNTPYAGGFTSMVCHDNVVGVQFHPEKSQRVGLKLLKNFLGWDPKMGHG